MTKKQAIIYNFVAEKKEATIREIIDFCKTNENFKGYIPECAKGVYCSLIRAKIFERSGNIIKLKDENHNII